MEINIVKNSSINNGKYLKEGHILETVIGKSHYEDISTIRLFLYNVRENTKTEIAPKLLKYVLGEVTNVSKNSDYIYFVTASQKEDDIYDACIVRYNFIKNLTEPIYSFEINMEEYNSVYRLKLFILNDICVLMQRDELVANFAETFYDYNKHTLKLYNINEECIYEVLDENFIKNGIESMNVISDSTAVIKTGFSLLPDNKYNLYEKEEMSVETISIVTIGQLISDIMIGQNNISTNIIDQAYCLRTFPTLEVVDEYLKYSAVNLETREEEIFFYNVDTKEVRSCINKNVIRMTDLAKIYFIDKKPWIMVNSESNIVFVNIDDMNNKLSFEAGLDFKSITGELIILSGEASKGILKKNYYDFFEIYSVNNKLLLREKGTYLFGICTENNEILIFVK